MSTLDLTKPVQTRAGTPVRILCTDRKGIYSIVGLWGIVEQPLTWTAEGKRVYYSGDPDDIDLINVPEPAIPHPHAELIKRWADNTNLRVEYYSERLAEWVEYKGRAAPGWDKDLQYRLVE